MAKRLNEIAHTVDKILKGFTKERHAIIMEKFKQGIPLINWQGIMEIEKHFSYAAVIKGNGNGGSHGYFFFLHRVFSSLFFNFFH